jgi:hypothetical protein
MGTDSMVSQSGETWTFRITCRQAQRVYLMVDFYQGATQMLWLEQVTPNVWQRTVTLQAGVYRFCYYVDDGVTTTFHLPPGCETDGMKAVLRVPPAEKVPEPPASARVAV